MISLSASDLHYLTFLTMDSKIPWEQLSLDTLKSLCQDLGLNKPQASRTDLIAYIKDISKNGGWHDSTLGSKGESHH